MKIQTLIAGGGLAGLACARELADSSHPYLLVEKQKEVGGLCRSVLDRGFSFDYTGHFLHFHKPALRQWASRFIGNVFKERAGMRLSIAKAVTANIPIRRTTRDFLRLS